MLVVRDHLCSADANAAYPSVEITGADGIRGLPVRQAFKEVP